MLGDRNSQDTRYDTLELTTTLQSTTDCSDSMFCQFEFNHASLVRCPGVFLLVYSVPEQSRLEFSVTVPNWRRLAHNIQFGTLAPIWYYFVIVALIKKIDN